MKRIIFSQYTEKVDPHTSVTDYNRNQFIKYKNTLIEKQKQYALNCNADYELFNTDHTNYVDIQFQKLLMFEKLSEHYDEVLYLDLDVIPIRKESFFKKFDLNNITAYDISTPQPDVKILTNLNEKDIWHPMDMYLKSCCKNAMLLLDDLKGKDSCINTGVVGMNKKAIDLLQFSDRLSECKSLLLEAKEDNLYPNEMSKRWQINNEVIFSYLIEKYKLPFRNTGMAWNFIVDHAVSEYSAASYFLHVVNKNFQDYSEAFSS